MDIFKNLSREGIETRRKEACRTHETGPEMSESEEERRPRPIGMADESEEGESDEERTGAAGGAAAPAENPAAADTGAGAAGPEETTAKKPRKMPAFSENDLVKEKGLRQIYKDFPQKCQFKGKGREVCASCFSNFELRFHLVCGVWGLGVPKHPACLLACPLIVSHDADL